MCHHQRVYFAGDHIIPFGYKFTQTHHFIYLCIWQSKTWAYDSHHWEHMIPLLWQKFKFSMEHMYSFHRFCWNLGLFLSSYSLHLISSFFPCSKMLDCSKIRYVGVVYTLLLTVSLWTLHTQLWSFLLRFKKNSSILSASYSSKPLRLVVNWL